MLPDLQVWTPPHAFPAVRPRRLRASAALRRMVREQTLQPSNFIYPLFVRSGRDIRRPISSMPGQFQLSVDQAAQEAREAAALGISAVILFAIPDEKDAEGSENYNPDGLVPRAARAIKDAAPDLLVISDMCFCEYTDHGHCGLLNLPGHAHYTPDQPVGYLLNDPTLELLGRASVVHAQAGVDMIAPSGMIDGMVGAIRQALDGAGLFRDAAESAPSFGNRDQYQMYPANRREARREVALDVAEGADIIMVKPALAYLDVIAELRSNHDLPVAAYQVSGEYSMLHAAAERGWLDLRRSALESLLSIKRAGADLILTYFAKDAARWLREDAGE
jgi:porphobilinogen synthase